MKRVSIRTLRAKLKSYLDDGKPVAIGSSWSIRAILIPIPEYDHRPESANAAIKATLDTITKSLTKKALTDWQKAE